MNEVNKFEEATLQIEEEKLRIEEAKLRFDEYKLWTEDTTRFSERRTTLPRTYVTINSVILGAIAFLLKETQFVIGWESVVIMPLLLAGIIACLQWRQLNVNYTKLVKLRIDRLRAMEELPEMEDRLKMYHAEDELYPREDELYSRSGQGMLESRYALNFSGLEGSLPWALFIVYVCFLFTIVARLIWS
jgi:hypothetical protein